VNAKEVQEHGYPTADARTYDMLPEDLKNDPIIFPAQDLLSPLEFGAAVTLTDPNRAELMARFKSA
jgi:spermidine/putrescine transport system substrate-binding protein